MEVVIVLAVLAVAVVLIAGPLRRRSASEPARSPELADLEAAKEAKFREIRDAELDYRTGKLSRDDWRAIDAALRAEAIEILRRLDVLGTAAPPEDKNP
jgi:hypothetical protein